ncbi:MAG: hypothetical protein AAF671_09760 [Pseudomonadota bacterium]
MRVDRTPYPRITYVDESMSELGSRFVDTIERFSGRKKLEAVYHQIKGEGLDDERFFARALELADIRYNVQRAKNENTLPEGPLVLIGHADLLSGGGTPQPAGADIPPLPGDDSVECFPWQRHGAQIAISPLPIFYRSLPMTPALS